MSEVNEKKVNRSAGKVVGAVFGNGALLLLTTFLVFLTFLVGVILVLTHGPSERAKYIFVNSCNETSALKFLPGWFLSDAEVEKLLTPEGYTDTFVELGYKPDNVNIADIGEEQIALSEGDTEGAAMEGIADDGFVDGIKIEDVTGETFRGKMMLVKDPSRVTIGVLGGYSEGGYGKYLYKFIEDYGAIGGVNGGGFADDEGKGKGGCPDGFVIKDGKIIYGENVGYCHNFVGFDSDHNLMLRSCNAKQALNDGAVEGFTFEMGSVLIRDGSPSKKLGGGYNPRTAIGQCEDGTILLCVIEGRHAASLGATRDDLVTIMTEYGAVNATMLDGGSSAEMRYDGEQLTRGSGLIGMRGLPNAVLVMPEDED